jgi:hypothetical protein
MNVGLTSPANAVAANKIGDGALKLEGGPSCRTAFLKVDSRVSGLPTTSLRNGLYSTRFQSGGTHTQSSEHAGHPTWVQIGIFGPRLIVISAVLTKSITIATMVGAIGPVIPIFTEMPADKALMKVLVWSVVHLLHQIGAALVRLVHGSDCCSSLRRRGDKYRRSKSGRNQRELHWTQYGIAPDVICSTC